LNNRASSRTVTAAISALVLLTAVLAYQSWWRFNPGLDLNIYLEATRAFWNGQNPYTIATPAPFVYPLFVCLMLWPLAQLPLEMAAVIWFAVSLACLGAALALLLGLSGRMNPGRALVACAIVCVLLTEILQNNLRNAQINFLVLACTAAFAWYWSRGLRGLASCCLAVAIAIKITPAVFLLWLARRRDWRTLVLTAAIAGGLTLVAPAVVAGPRALDDMRGYVETFIGGVQPGYGTTSERRPFSVVGALHRFTNLSWPFDTVVLGLSVLLVTVLVFDRGSPGGEATAPLVSLYLVAVLLVTPLSEVHHLAFILPGVVWLTYRALSGELSRPRLAVLAFVIGALLLRRSFHAAAIAAVSSAWFLLAAECSSPRRARGSLPADTPDRVTA
jgi:alpha-1,2-mannosyltransferase